MDSENNFSKGMQSDVSKLLSSPDTYLKAVNLRAISQLGESNGSLVNIKGTNCEITFPEVKGVYKLVINKQYDGSGNFLPGTVNITINGQSTGNFPITISTTINDIIFRLNQLNNNYLNTTSTDDKTFSLAYNETEIVIFQQPKYIGCASDLSVEPVINAELIAGSTRIDFLDLTGASTVSYVPMFPALNNDNVVIIGSTFINETIYLYTTGIINTNNLGQIWELSYDELTRDSTIKLIYNGNLNFSIDYPIPPSATEGRYELEELQRIYWTDNNNPVRSINVKDSNIMALTVDLINLKPSVDMSIPTLDLVGDGDGVDPLNTAATYQCAYRLIKNNGAVSNYSVASNIVYINPNTIAQYVDGQPNYCSMTGGNTTINKSITWRVNGIDTAYDIIEFIVIVRFFPNQDGFNIFKFDQKLINGQSYIKSKFTNDTIKLVEISESEFLIENTSFTTAKTIEQKDNRLFFGNVKNSLVEYLDTYDTRAFRFNASTNNIAVKKLENDTTALITDVSVDGYSLLDETSDNIGLLNLGLQADSSIPETVLYNNNYKYQRNSTVIGGTGPNVSYSFGNLLLMTDRDTATPTQSSLSGINGGTDSDISPSSESYVHGYRIPARTYQLDPFSNLAPNQSYNINSVKESMGLEYLNGTFKTGQHNEVYRIGIQFYSKTGESNFVKWIGDIKFPDYSDSSDSRYRGLSFNNNTCPDFRSVYYEGTPYNRAYNVLPYLVIDVNITDELSKLISGYEIVMVERTNTDKSIISQGLINQVATGIGSESNNYFLPVSHYSSLSGWNAMDPPTYQLGGPNGHAANAYYLLMAYHSFDSLVNKSSGFNVDDKIVISEKYSYVLNSSEMPGSTPGSSSSFEEYYYISKYYNLISFPYNAMGAGSTIFNLKDSDYADSAATTKIINGLGTYHNYDYYDDGTLSYTNQAYANGSPTVIISTELPFLWENFNNGIHNVTNGDSKLLALQYRPIVLKTQYGGRTYLARTENEYISMGAFYPINSAGLKTIKVFGGDIYHSIMDIQKAIKNFSGTGKPSATQKHSQTWFFPHQSNYNIELREGSHVNKDLNNDSGTAASGADEYNYTISYSYKNTLRKFIPKPAFFNNTNSWNNRIYWTSVKINGENLDSWSVTPVNNYYDIDGTYGPITSLNILKNNMFCLQERALAMLLINPYEITTTQNNQSVGLGSGNTLAKHIYYSVDIGSKHQWSVYASNSHITFIDVRHKKIYLFDGQNINPISDTKGNKSFVNKVLHNNILITDNPIKFNGILTTYDFINNEFLYTFLNSFVDGRANIQEKYTLVYTDLTQTFTSFYNTTPYIYVNNHNKLYSVDTYTNGGVSKLYMNNIGDYGNFYGNIYPSTIKVIINDNPKVTKVFDNLNWVSESIKDNRENIDDINNYLGDSDNINYLNDTFARVRIYNEYQNSDWTNLNTTGNSKNLKKAEQGYNLQIPRNKVNYDSTSINTKSIFDSSILTKTIFKDRIRDKYLIVDLEYDNMLNNRFIIHNLGSTYRQSSR